MGIPRCLVNGVSGRFWHKDLESWATIRTGYALCFFLNISSFSLSLHAGLSWLCCGRGLPQSSTTPFTIQLSEAGKSMALLPSLPQFQIDRKGDADWPRLAPMTALTQRTVAGRQAHRAQNGSSRGHCELGTFSEEFPVSMKLRRGES